LAGVIGHAYEYGSSSPGSKSAEAEFDVVDLTDRASPKSSPFIRPATFGDEQPPNREWAVEGWIPAGKTTLISGDGGVGKTLIAQQLLTAVATPGATWFDKKVVHGPVLGVFSEDDTNEMWRRQIDVCRAMDIPMPSLTDVNWWTLDSVAATGCVLMSFTRENPEGKVGLFFRRLDEAMEQLKPVMVVLDPIANMFGGNELDRAQVTGFVNRTLNRLCTKHGATMIALVHPSLSGMTEGTGRSGSTGWANAVRSRLYLTRPEKDPAGDYRELRPTKNNYGRLDDKIDLRWSSGAFVRATPGSEDDPVRVAQRALLSAMGIVAERDEPMTMSKQSPYYAVKQVRGMPEVKGIALPLLGEALEMLLRDGKLRLREHRTKDRKTIDVIEITTNHDEFARADEDI
jgi:RecA-family ATPase